MIPASHLQGEDHPQAPPSPAHHRGILRIFALYKGVISPVLHALAISPGGCCYQPTCSEYAALACAQHGLLRGGTIAAWRVLRCNPFSRGGWDPVPPVPEQLYGPRTPV